MKPSPAGQVAAAAADGGPGRVSQGGFGERASPPFPLWGSTAPPHPLWPKSPSGVRGSVGRPPKGHQPNWVGGGNWAEGGQARLKGSLQRLLFGKERPPPHLLLGRGIPGGAGGTSQPPLQPPLRASPPAPSPAIRPGTSLLPPGLASPAHPSPGSQGGAGVSLRDRPLDEADQPSRGAERASLGGHHAGLLAAVGAALGGAGPAGTLDGRRDHRGDRLGAPRLRRRR